MFSFAAPLFLFGLGALAAPLIIHLINRERAEPVRFPSIRFIPASTLPQRGRRTPKDWILLLLRLLFFALIVMTLAQPRWSDAPEILAIGDDAKPTVFVVDASASMNAGDTWSSAKELVEEQVRELPSGSAVALVVFSNDVIYSTELGAGQSLNFDSIEPSQMSAQPSVGINKALSLLPDDEPSELVLISDFQANEWSGANLRAIPENVDLRLERVSAKDTANVAVLSAEAYPSTGGNLRVITRLKNFSDTEQLVKVTLNEAEEQEVTIAPQGVEPVIFITKNNGGEAGVISLSFPEGSEGDAYALDDVFRFWLGAPAPVRVGTIFSEIDEPEKMAEIDFVARALETSAETGHRPFDLFALTPDMLSDPQTRPDILYLAGSGGYLSDDQLEMVKTYISDGGSLLVTPSKSAARQQRRLRESGLTKAAYIGQPGRHRDQAGTFHIGEIAEQSRLGQVFDDDTARDLFMAEIYQYARLKPGDDARILLSEEGGDPLLFDETVGKGNVLTSALGFDGGWSDLPLRNSFLPLLRESLADSASGEAVLRLPLGEMEGIDEPTAFWGGTQAVEINVDRRESDFTPASLTDVRQAFTGSGRKVASVDTSNTFTGLELWPWFALAALLVYLTETLLAGSPERKPVARYA
ncbi:BatA domain-containing protein [Rubellicoccus peritrichatus]|uniref:BatA domain-containing protein n=1 Tax=Rubellicoccus peritrichatus TaxID=3080537 RepID=A0AAQ3LC19_9BACT|nr:BatA domain-containing protein [Puniceicoccus sp. CR14]WOO41110.1 BatA domain-containing protein [Puniceicoccus sp. CR14]